ncbi:hypothetical protein Mal15_55730 [Stieleria maiorica]|uniref:Uncharacterized protein n=1 Tax=Stieleria maiorica TaxID=2795974 RepID=A0A5B9MPA8_9BACT|nr:hypothetical protein [Stieleria maiorica]QEG01496.1 hypothetical protein Mal15_55730 [Stieleria maiorica]
MISSSYASDARFCGAATSVRTFLMMHMGFSTVANSATNARLSNHSRSKTAALSRDINNAGNFDALVSDFFTRKSENAQATEQCSSRKHTFDANVTGGHAFG